MGKRILNEALRTIVNAEKRGKATANLQPISNLMSSFLNIMKGRGYIKDFQVYDPHRVGKITVELQGRIKDIRVLMYRQDLKAKEIEEYRLRTLPSRRGVTSWFQLPMVFLITRKPSNKMWVVRFLVIFIKHIFLMFRIESRKKRGNGCSAMFGLMILKFS